MGIILHWVRPRKTIWSFYSPHTNPTEADDLHVQLIDLGTLLRQADFISVHANVTSETWGVLGERELSLMKPADYLICISRAAVIDQAALI